MHCRQRSINYLVHSLDVRLDDMVCSQFACPNDCCNIRGTFRQEKVLTELDAGLPFVPQPREERLQHTIDKDVKDNEDVLQQTDGYVHDHVLELGLPRLKDKVPALRKQKKSLKVVRNLIFIPFSLNLLFSAWDCTSSYH